MKEYIKTDTVRASRVKSLDGLGYKTRINLEDGGSISMSTSDIREYGVKVDSYIVERSSGVYRAYSKEAFEIRFLCFTDEGAVIGIDQGSDGSVQDSPIGLYMEDGKPIQEYSEVKDYLYVWEGPHKDQRTRFEVTGWDKEFERPILDGLIYALYTT